MPRVCRAWILTVVAAAAASLSRSAVVVPSNDLREAGFAYTVVDRKLADSMSTYWVNFVTTGDPNMKGLPRWELYDLGNEPYLEFAGAIRQGRHLFRDRLDFQERFRNRAREAQTAPALPARPASPAQSDPVVGNWRGTLKNAQGVDSPIIITVAKKGDGYTGSTGVRRAPIGRIRARERWQLA
jgi:Carboxylesterase family